MTSTLYFAALALLTSAALSRSASGSPQPLPYNLIHYRDLKRMSTDDGIQYLKQKIGDDFPNAVNDVYTSLASEVRAENALIDLVLSLDDLADRIVAEVGQEMDTRPAVGKPDSCLTVVDSREKRALLPRTSVRGQNKEAGRYARKMRYIYYGVRRIAQHLVWTTEYTQHCASKMSEVSTLVANISAIMQMDVHQLSVPQVRSCVGLYRMMSLPTADEMDCSSVSRCIRSLSYNVNILRQKTDLYLLNAYHMHKNCDDVTELAKALVSLLEGVAESRPDVLRKYANQDSTTTPAGQQ